MKNLIQVTQRFLLREGCTSIGIKASKHICNNLISKIHFLFHHSQMCKSSPQIKFTAGLLNTFLCNMS